MHTDLTTNQLVAKPIGPAGRVPEILAPAGGRVQFLAALQSGADAVYLGLKDFNARARAENFSIDDLRELLPLAQRYGMKVLVTFNILLKDSELPAAIATLAVLEELGVHALIVQDLAVASLVRQYFPALRLHASTQMAVHNLWGVQQAKEFGFKRVVLAREMTAQELRQIRNAPQADGVELEAFCHGSLCYSYSGLCFFSGAEDARSGNRGECAYTCRQPYKIVSEPGHGFLFSMRDLDTAAYLQKFIDAGIDCLKIEGRKKDAQYVASVVRVYRQKLDAILGYETLRPEARDLVARSDASEESASAAADLAVTFQRRGTSLFLSGRYHENVIDLDNPTHIGLPVGVISVVEGSRVSFRSQEPLARFDGLRIQAHKKVFHARPQDGERIGADVEADAQRRYDNAETHFSLREMYLGRRSVAVAPAGEIVTIEIPEAAAVAVGDTIFKTRSNALKQRIERISSAPAGHDARALRRIDLDISLHPLADSDTLRVEVVARKLSGRVFCSEVFHIARQAARQPSQLGEDLQKTLALFGDIAVAARVAVNCAGDLRSWFVPRSELKALKNKIKDSLALSIEQSRIDLVADVVAKLGRPRCEAARVASSPRFAVKIDRLEYVPTVLGLRCEYPQLGELVFEPKRAFIDPVANKRWLQDLLTQTQASGVVLRIAIPTVLRAWDEPLLRVWLQDAYQLGVRAFEVGNIGALQLLEQWGLRRADVDISSDFTLYSLNRTASRFWSEQGISKVTLSIEDDFANLQAHLSHWQAESAAPQVILYKDTPLFIAEACTLTALHGGCPTAKVCGYRSLEIENPKGERFHVAHESCKSIVYGEQAFSWSQHLNKLRTLAVDQFRVDFLTRHYTAESISSILRSCLGGAVVSGTHEANFSRELL